MQMVHKGEYPGKSTVSFLPMIDMSATDMSCIYSTLTFVCNLATRYDVSPVLTFDQPLYWKALTIVQNEKPNSQLKSLVLRLGGFHTEMSFLGSIGHIMSNSGIQEILELIYAPNAVSHILNGKAVARALRAHMLIDTALHCILTSDIFGIQIPGQVDDDLDQVNENKSEIMHKAAVLHTELFEGNITTSNNSTILKTIDNTMVTQLES
ncbi:Hypothetical predicted protein [Mytilus galloprovincialis]|nr:Hypothetical predicted protein [Mytilus galloprovincialis]